MKYFKESNIAQRFSVMKITEMHSINSDPKTTVFRINSDVKWLIDTDGKPSRSFFFCIVPISELKSVSHDCVYARSNADMQHFPFSSASVLGNVEFKTASNRNQNLKALNDVIIKTFEKITH